jgi:hypothetical protein
MIDVKTPESPGWWLRRCSVKLEARTKRIDPLFARYEGNAPVPSSLANAPDAAKHFFCVSRTNFAEMVVRAVRYRLRVAGILTAASMDEVGDAEAYDLWRRSGMAHEHHDVNRNTLVAGDAYVLCAEYKGKPAATAEDPRQVVTIHDPVRQSEILAAAKLFHDDVADVDLGYLFLPGDTEDGPGRRWVAKRSRKMPRKGAPPFTASGWEWDTDSGGANGESVPVSMPMVRFRNEEGVGEFERHLDILDRIDHLILQGMVIATLQAFKQRAIQVPAADMPDVDPKTGVEIDYNDVFTADPGALWKLPETAKMWESGAVDLTPITTMATKEIERLSAVTFTPMSMFTPEAANQSAAGASLVKEGLTTKVEDKQARLEGPYAQVLSILGRIAGIKTLKDPFTIKIRWAPAERYSLGEKADAGMKAKAADVPWRTRMRQVWQMDPEDIERMASERMDDEALASLLTPPPPNATPAPTPASTAVPAVPAAPVVPVGP